MVPQDPRTPEGDAATEVVLSTFRANGLFLAAGDLVAAGEGLTSARWQVLGALALAGRPLTVPQIARRVGVTRQSGQASVIRLTDRGSARYAALQRHQAEWINELAAGMQLSELSTAARVLRQLGNRLDTIARGGGREQ